MAFQPPGETFLNIILDSPIREISNMPRAYLVQEDSATPIFQFRLRISIAILGEYFPNKEKFEPLSSANQGFEGFRVSEV